jgi:hypothetical protein
MNQQLTQQVVLFGSGTILGALLTFITMEIAFVRHNKRTDAEFRLKLANEIINDTLKFFFKTNDILNDLWLDKKIWAKIHAEDQLKSYEIEQRMLRRFEDHTKKDFFNELMYHSYRLRQLEDNSLFNEFESLMHAFKDLAGQVLVAKTSNEYTQLDTKYQELKKSFLAKCAQVTKAN